jgi:serine-type D-Ala-D-Ala carboxypeptidase (penicillin-binding protein 5/6)
MSRVWLLVGIAVVLLPSASVASEQAESILELRIESPASTESGTPIAPQVPPLPAESKAPVAFEKIGSGREPDIKGASAVLVDADTGQILYSRKPDYRRPVASITKIMTAMVVLDHCDLDGYVVTSTAASKVPHTSLNLRAGERLTVRDMLYGLMIRSANDAAHALADHVSGSVPRFSQLMNRKATDLGLKDTHFRNPHGLYVDGQYSTAYDVSVLAREALRNPTFDQIVGTRSRTIKRSHNTQDVTLQARSPFMRNYEGADGIKSGYTRQSGYCYVGSATRDGWRLISVILKSDNASRDAMALTEYGFQNFRRVVVAPKDGEYDFRIAGGKKKVASAVPADQLNVVMAREDRHTLSTEKTFEQLRAPVSKGQQVGQITAYVDGEPIESVALLSAEDVDRSLIAAAWLWTRWPMMFVPILALFLTAGRRLTFGRTPAKNTLRRRRRFTQAVRGTNL